MTRSDITEALEKKLQVTARLDDENLHAIRSMPISVKQLAANQPIVREGDRSSSCCLCIEGYVVRSKTTPSGHRQILSVHIPGDIPDLHSLYLNVMDHDLVALTDCTVGLIAHEVLRDLVRYRANIAELLWRETLVDAAIFREWIVNLGQRPSSSRMAHFVLEMFHRLKVVGKTSGNSLKVPMTQQHLGEALGISIVHVNRILKELRGQGLMEMHRGVITIHDERGLEQLGEFDRLYLHQNPAL